MISYLSNPCFLIISSASLPLRFEHCTNFSIIFSGISALDNRVLISSGLLSFKSQPLPIVTPLDYDGTCGFRENQGPRSSYPSSSKVTWPLSTFKYDLSLCFSSLIISFLTNQVVTLSICVPLSKSSTFIISLLTSLQYEGSFVLITLSTCMTSFFHPLEL